MCLRAAVVVGQKIFYRPFYTCCIQTPSTCNKEKQRVCEVEVVVKWLCSPSLCLVPEQELLKEVTTAGKYPKMFLIEHFISQNEEILVQTNIW